MIKPDAKNYHDPETKREFMSHSQYRAWLTCAAATYAEIFKGYQPRKTTALIVGGYVDRALTAPEEFAQYCEEFKSDIYGAKGGKLADFKKADMLIDRLEKDPTWQIIMAASRKQVVMEGEIGGVPFLYMADMMMEAHGTETVIDLKTACDFEDDWTRVYCGPASEPMNWVNWSNPKFFRNQKVNWIDAAGYWRQLGVGRELFKQTREKREPVCAIIGAKKPVTDERPVGLGLWVMDDNARLDAEIRQIEVMLPMVMKWKTGEELAPGCGLCDYCLGISSLENEQVAISERSYTV